MTGTLESPDKITTTKTEVPATTDAQVHGQDADKGNTWADVARREAQLLGAVGTGFVDAAKDSVKSENLPWTIGKLALTTAASIALARFRPVTALGQVLMRGAAVGGGVAFGADVVSNGIDMSKAMADAWGPNADMDKDLSVARGTLGRFAFDTALNLPFAVGATKLASRGAGAIEAAAASTRAAETPLAADAAPVTSRPSETPTTGSSGSLWTPGFVPAKARFDNDPTFAQIADRRYQLLRRDNYATPILMPLVPELGAAARDVLGNIRINSFSDHDRYLGALQNRFNAVYRRAGLPDILKISERNSGYNGTEHFGEITIAPNIVRDGLGMPNGKPTLEGQAQFFSILAHEGEHVEGDGLVVQRVADKFGIGRDPLLTDIDAIINEMPQSQLAHGASSKDMPAEINPDFIRSALSVRPLGGLDPQAERRADMLLGSLKLPVDDILLKRAIERAHEFKLWAPHLRNDYAQYFDEVRTWKPEGVPLGVRETLEKSIAAVDNGQLSKGDAGLNIFKAADAYEDELIAKRDALPRYPNFPHEAEAFAVEGRAYDWFVNALTSANPYARPRSWAEMDDAFSQPVRRFMSG